MIQAALYAALGCAVLSALAGSRTAWILLASAAFCLALDEAGARFNPVLWMMIDLVVVLLILRPKMSAADVFIIALFIPGWVFYMLPDDQRYAGSVAVAIAQLLLAVDPHKIASAPRCYREWWKRRPDSNEMVAHVRLAGACP